MAKVSIPIVFTLVVGGIALIYFYTTGPDTTAPTTRKSTANKTTSKTKVDLIEPEDYKVRFASLNETPKDAFKPLIVGKNALKGSQKDPSFLPSLLTDGESNWSFTGIVEVNGTKMALLENSSTGEGVYLKTGEHWKSVIVSSIADETLLLIGPDGAPNRIKLGDQEAKTNANVVAANPTPVQPSLQGVIGNGAMSGPGGMATLPGVSPNMMGGAPGMGSGGFIPGVGGTGGPGGGGFGGRRRGRGGQ